MCAAGSGGADPTVVFGAVFAGGPALAPTTTATALTITGAPTIVATGGELGDVLQRAT